MYNKKHRNDTSRIHDSQNNISRRKLLKTAGGAALATTMGLKKGAVAARDELRTSMSLKGNIKHSVCEWCYENISIEELSENCARIGIKSVELVNPRDWPVLKKNGLICAMIETHSIEKGLNRKENHDYCLNLIREGIEAASEAGFPNVICFSGNREGMPDDEGLENCAEGLEQIVGLAEKKGVSICFELLNSKKWGHADYMCDNTDWGIQLVKRVASPSLKLLYDIYHMQIMEGDIIRTIRDNIEYIAHFHTGGVPGRNEIDETQELNYAAIMRAIAETNFDGYVAQEFIPKRDPIKSLEQAIQICDV